LTANSGGHTLRRVGVLGGTHAFVRFLSVVSLGRIDTPTLSIVVYLLSRTCLTRLRIVFVRAGGKMPPFRDFLHSSARLNGMPLIGHCRKRSFVFLSTCVFRLTFRVEKRGICDTVGIRAHGGDFRTPTQRFRSNSRRALLRKGLRK
jgi:hypothetical protein